MRQSFLQNRNTILSIRSSLSSFGKGLRSANESSRGIVRTVNEGNVAKRKSIFERSKLFLKRRQAVLRREQEDLVEATKVSSFVNRSPAKKIASSTKGFLGRIMDFLGTIVVGWILLNLPRIIKGVEALIEKIQAVIKVLQEWYNKVVSWFTSFNATLTQKLQELNLISFEGDKKAIEGEVNTSNTALDNIIQDIEDGIDRLKNWTKETFGPKFSTTRTTEPSTSPGGGNNRVSTSKFVNKNLGGQPQDLLGIIRGAEGGYGSTYAGYLKDFKRSGEDITQMTITELVKYQNDYLNHQRKLGIPANKRSAAVGAYQMLHPDRYVEAAGLTMSSKFTPENQDKLAQAFLAERGLTAERAAKDPRGFGLELSKGFAGIPVLETVQGYKQQVERGQSYYAGDGLNKASQSITPEIVEEAIKKYGESFNVEGNKPDEVSTVRRQSPNIAQSPDQNIEVPIPIPATKVAANPPPSSPNGGSDGTVAANQSGGTSLNSFIFTELQYT